MTPFEQQVADALERLLDWRTLRESDDAARDAARELAPRVAAAIEAAAAAQHARPLDDGMAPEVWAVALAALRGET